MSVRLRPATFADYESVEALKARFDLAATSEGRWHHLYDANPLLERLPGAWPIGWALEDGGGRVVGFIGNLPCAYELDERPLVGASAYGWVVDLEHRVHSFRLVREFFAQPGVDLFLSTTATGPAGLVLERLGAGRPPVGGYDEALFWVTGAAGFARSALRRRRAPSTLAGPVGLGIVAAQRLRRSRPLRSAEVEEVASFDGRFDAFWGELRSRGGTLLCERGRAALAWHYAAPIAEGSAWTYALVRNGEVRAYAVFLRRDVPALGLTRVRLADFQALERPAEALDPLLAAGLERCGREGVHMLEAIGFGPEKRAALERLAPFRRRLPSWMFWYRAREEGLAARLADPAVWDPCGYDGDASF